MKREIEFRGKTECNKWVFGHLVINENDKYIIHSIDQGLIHYKKLLLWNYIDPATIGQYTGLKDKNGAKIFEGDILKIPDNYDEYGIYAGEIYEVIFRFGGFRMKPKLHKNCKGFWIEDDNTFTVIGNIHDNQELLK